MIIALTLLLATQSGVPSNMPAQQAANYTRVGSPSGRCSCRVMDANTTSYPFVFSTSQTNGNSAGGNGTGARPICYGWGTQVVVTASDEVTMCWTLTTSASIGSQTTPQRAFMTMSVGTDAYSGDGNCFTINGAGTWTSWPDYWTLGNYKMANEGTTTSTTVGGWRPGICTNTQANCPGGQKPLIPGVGKNRDCRVPLCTIDNDCVEAGVSGGTCSAIDTPAEIANATLAGCSFLMGKATNASTEVCACPEH